MGFRVSAAEETFGFASCIGILLGFGWVLFGFGWVLVGISNDVIGFS